MITLAKRSANSANIYRGEHEHNAQVSSSTHHLFIPSHFDYEPICNAWLLGVLRHLMGSEQFVYSKLTGGKST